MLSVFTLDVRLNGCESLGVYVDQQILLAAFAETVRDMKNLTLDLYSAHKSTPGSGNETVISIVYLIVIFGGETS